MLSVIFTIISFCFEIFINHFHALLLQTFCPNFNHHADFMHTNSVLCSLADLMHAEFLLCRLFAGPMHKFSRAHQSNSNAAARAAGTRRPFLRGRRSKGSDGGAMDDTCSYLAFGEARRHLRGRSGGRGEAAVAAAAFEGGTGGCSGGASSEGRSAEDPASQPVSAAPPFWRSGPARRTC
jgi:hypothetical protein